MKITTKLVIDIETGATIAHEWYEYDGPIAKLCGGDALTNQKQQAATSQAQLSAEEGDLAKKAAAIQYPFLKNLTENGLPFMPQLEDYSSGTIAKSFAPAKAAQARSLAGYGDTLPSGFRQQSQDNLNASEGEAFDQNQVQNLMLNQQAKTSAASMLNPAQYFTGASGANGSILSAPPLQSGGIGNFLGGALSGALNNVSVGAKGAWSL